MERIKSLVEISTERTNKTTVVIKTSFLILMLFLVSSMLKKLFNCFLKIRFGFFYPAGYVTASMPGYSRNKDKSTLNNE